MLLACKPTPRTARKETPEQPPTVAEQPADSATEAPRQDQPAEPPVEMLPPGLLDVRSTRQEYNRVRPWEKMNPSTGHFNGIYLGNGRVLVVGRAARAATYVEISLPDRSRTVPARVVKFDDELGLALLTVEHTEDASIFDSLTAHEVGPPMALGDRAEVATLVQGETPVRVGVVVEEVSEEATLPQLELRSEKPLPPGVDAGSPILQGNQLVAIVTEDDASEQSLTAINAEFIRHFLEESTAPGSGVPVLGMRFTQLDDPAFSKYLKINPEQGGLYVSEVMPNSAAQAAGVLAGDVITSIEGLPLDKLGRCKHPLYGLMGAIHVIRSLKPIGQHLTLGISRDGEAKELTVALNRDAIEKSLLGQERPDVAPRYIMWGGLLFQPLSQTYLDTLRERAGSLPLQLLQVKDNLANYSAEGRRELVALTIVIPTPATLGYDSLGFCLVEKVNGKRVHSFSEFAELLDAPTDNGLVEFSITRAPYTIYMDRQVVESTNDAIRRRSIPKLREMGSPAEAK